MPTIVTRGALATRIDACNCVQLLGYDDTEGAQVAAVDVSPNGNYLYAGEPGTITTLEIDATTGRPSATSVVDVSAPPGYLSVQSTALKAAPNGDYLYVGVNNDEGGYATPPEVLIYSVGSAGALTYEGSATSPEQGAPVQTQYPPAYVAVDASSESLYQTDFIAASYSISGSTLTTVTAPDVTGVLGNIIVSPSGSYAYACGGGLDAGGFGILIFSRSGSALTYETVAGSANYFNIAVSPDGAYVYGAGPDGNTRVDIYAAGTNSLTFVASANIPSTLARMSDAYVTDVVVSPDGLRVYALVRIFWPASTWSRSRETPRRGCSPAPAIRPPASRASPTRPTSSPSIPAPASSTSAAIWATPIPRA